MLLRGPWRILPSILQLLELLLLTISITTTTTTTTIPTRYPYPLYHVALTPLILTPILTAATQKIVAPLHSAGRWVIRKTSRTRAAQYYYRVFLFCSNIFFFIYFFFIFFFANVKVFRLPPRFVRSVDVSKRDIKSPGTWARPLVNTAFFFHYLLTKVVSI